MYSWERASVPMQEDPLPPEESLRGSSPKAASWPAGEAVCAGSPSRGDATAFQLSLQQLPIAGMAPGAMLTQQSKATKVGNNARKSSLAFQHLPGRCPSSCIKFFFLPPTLPTSSLKGKRVGDGSRELLVQVQEVNRAKRAQFGLLCPNHVSG